MNPNDNSSATLFINAIDVSQTSLDHYRRIYGIYDILGELGGV